MCFFWVSRYIVYMISLQAIFRKCVVLMSEPADVASQPAGSGPSYHVGRNQRVDLFKIQR